MNIGISRKDYFYYMCLSMIPFSIIMIVVEYYTNQLKFYFNIIPFILLILAMFLRYKKQHTIVGCLKYLNPYEDASYLTLGIVIAFIIDVVLGIEKFSYITHYILQYWSNAVFILFLNLSLTIIFSKGYTIKYNKEHKKIIKWVFVQQTFDFLSLYLSNLLSANSVTLSSYVRPTSIVAVVIISMFFKDKEKKPSIKQLLAIALVIAGILLIDI